MLEWYGARVGARCGLVILGLMLVVCACGGPPTKVGPAPAPASRVPPNLGNEWSGDESSPSGALAGGRTSPAGSSGVVPTGGRCSSNVYPAGETCAECLARCCGERECQGNGACLGYRGCVGECKRGLPCEQGCTVDCPTGSEPVCYLTDCHHWMCRHACGSMPVTETGPK